MRRLPGTVHTPLPHPCTSGDPGRGLPAGFHDLRLLRTPVDEVSPLECVATIRSSQAPEPVASRSAAAS